MFGHSLAKELESWWATYGGRHDSPEWHAFLDDFTSLLHSKVGEQREEHDNAGRFGMSKAGGCTRAATLKLLGAEPTPFTGSTRVTFWNGHMIEVLGLATLRAIGLKVQTSENGRQIAAKIDPFMLSYTDGIIEPDPRLGNVRSALSVKSAGFKMSGKNRDGSWKRYGFAQYPFDGLKKTNPKYWAQSQAEMLALELQQSVLLVVAKDIIKAMEGDPYMGPKGNGSLSFYVETTPYDAEWCASQLVPTWSEAWESYKNGQPGPARVITASGEYVEIAVAGDTATNKALTGSYNDCDYCDLREACVTAKLATRSPIRAAVQEVLNA